ncbi:MAG: OmcA/MtrC family decaheme c-type cytochrome [Ketobacteraceae bacterium]|nr:OmcA/MtrC family decaheme c-type cytochrome [Ketobacteraceae bacterium]
MNTRQQTRQGTWQHWFTAVLVALLTGCGGGGGDSAQGVLPGPTAPGGDVDPINVQPADPATFADADQIQAQITGITIASPPQVSFTIADQSGKAITDLTAGNVSFSIAKLVPGTNGDSDHWQSYINTTEQPGVGPGLEAKVQATRERNGTLEHLGDGSYVFTFATDIANVTSPVAVPYEPELTHRVAIQFSGGPVANPTYTWQPSTGAISNIRSYDVVKTETCNQCHGTLAIHGGGRREIKYCVTCHNPGSADANSGNTVDFKVMVHKIHRGANLPSVQAGGSYLIYGFRNSVHDYSNVHYPQDIRNCTNCHAGTATGSGDDILTNQGDNWAIKPTQEACGSCHDTTDFSLHQGGQDNNSECVNCHTQQGTDISVVDAHSQPIQIAAQRFEFNIHTVTDTAPGQFPQITYSVTDPTNNDQPYDLLNDTSWTSTGNGASRLAIDLAWNTADYHNTGNGAQNASAVSINALANAVAVGNGQYRVTSSIAIPDGSTAPFVAAEGSGAAVLEGHPAVDVGTAMNPDVQRIPVKNTVSFFSIDEASGTAQPRRSVVSLDKCQNCHETLSLHGNNRTDNIDSCVTCHNPRNTDRGVREVAVTPPTDGKQEESLDFKTMIHGIHAAGFRENPLQIVGFRGFSTYVFDEDQVHYPNSLENCTACHEEGTYTVPLASNVLGTTVDTGDNREDPADDEVITPTAAVCASCHDSNSAIGHMVSPGGARFDTTQAAIDAGTVVETCNICHAEGRSAAVSAEHGIQ